MDDSTARPPMIITESTRQKMLEMSPYDDVDEMLEREGYIVVDDAVLAGGGARYEFEMFGGNLSITVKNEGRR